MYTKTKVFLATGTKMQHMTQKKSKTFCSKTSKIKKANEIESGKTQLIKENKSVSIEKIRKQKTKTKNKRRKQANK